MQNPVVIFGAGTLGRLALDIFNSNNVLVYGFLDEDVKLHNTSISEVVVLGDTMDDGFLKIIGNKTEAFVAIENQTHKEKLVKMLQDRRKTMPVNALHAQAFISEDAELGYGILVGAKSVVNPGTKIGNHVIINSGVVIDTLASIEEFVEIGSGAIINAEVEIEYGVFIGSGAIILNGIKIGKNARVGAGSVVIADVKAGDTVFGNPAVSIKK